MTVNVLSLGGGVQSTTLLLMAEAGEIERPDLAIFADTQWEPRAVYEHLHWLEQTVSIPIVRVTAGNLRSDALSPDHAFASMPLYVKTDKLSYMRRQCTKEYKIRPIHRYLRTVLKERGLLLVPGIVQMMIGISIDEIGRVRPSRVQWVENTWPLIDLHMSRADCKDWLRKNGYSEPTKSACIGCPFRDNASWRELKNNSNDEWQDATMFDRTIRFVPRIEGECYIHVSLKPLEDVDLRTVEDMGQLSMFNSECEGMCGV